MSSSSRYASLLVAGLLLWTAFSAQADIYSLVRKITMNELQLEARVTDMSGKPLPGAIMWYFGRPVRPEAGLNLTLADVQSMARRYAGQSDFLVVGDVSVAVIERTNLQGQFKDFRETGDNGNQYSYILVATKRGYLPEVVEGAAPYNKHHVVEIKLQRDPDARIDPRMEEFDRWMALARTVEPEENVISEERMHRLRKLEQETRALAESLVREGLNDEASAVYWALADFPEVTMLTTQDGRQQITGYRNGRTDKAAQADRDMARKLNTKVPSLLIGQYLMERGFPSTGIKTEAHGLAYLDGFEELAAGPLGNQILPRQYITAFAQHNRFTTPEQACAMLKRAYAVEPAAFSRKEWLSRLREIEYQTKRLKRQSVSCLIEGLTESLIDIEHNVGGLSTRNFLDDEVYLTSFN